jgi:hypothetical protein
MVLNSPSEFIASSVYFAAPGPQNTARTLELVCERAAGLGASFGRQVLVASSSGATGLQAARALPGLDVIVVSHSAGFAGPNLQELTEESRAAILAAGARILTCQHAFGGVGRAVRRKLATYQVDEIMAYTLRTFGQGMKVCAELCLMAADAGLVRTDAPVIAVAGTGSGADTAALIRPANSQDFFELRFLEIICMPSPGHPF